MTRLSDADTHARSGGHAVFERTDEIAVDNHCFVIAFFSQAHLLDEALILIDRVVQLRVGVGKFLTVDHQLETFGELRIVAVSLCQRRHLDGIVGDECRLDIVAFAFLAEYLVDELAFAQRVVNLYVELAADVAELLLVHAGYVDAGVFPDGVDHCHAAERRLEGYDVVADFHFGRAVDVEAYLLEHALGEVHHPVVVFVGHVYLHACELGVVGAVHSLVAEILGEFIDSVKSAHNETFQIKFVGYAEIERNVERVVVSDERTRGSSAGNRLKDGGLDFHVAVAVEEFAHGVIDFGALDEYLLDTLVDNEIHITAAVAELGIVERVISDTVLHLYDGKGAERLGQDGDLFGMHGYLAHLGSENIAFYSDEVTDVKKFF